MTNRGRPHACRTQNGFTLVETLLLLLILAMLVAITLPEVQARGQRRADAAAMDLAQATANAVELRWVKHRTFRTPRAALLRRVPGLRDAASWSVTGTRRTFSVRVRATDGRMFRLRRRGNGRLIRDCGPAGGSCRDGRW